MPVLVVGSLAVEGPTIVSVLVIDFLLVTPIFDRPNDMTVLVLQDLIHSGSSFWRLQNVFRPR